MARLIYACLALALGTLIAGFLIRDSSVPLLVSIALSALVLLLILVGTSRRLRRSQALEDEAADLSSLEVVEVTPDEAEETVAAPRRQGAAARRKATARPARPGAATDDTQTIEAIDEPAAEPEVTEVVERPARTRKAAKPRPPRRKPGTIVEPELGDEAFPEFAVLDDEPSGEDDTAGAEERVAEAEERVEDAEPPVVADTPPVRKRAAPRRKPAAARGGARSPSEPALLSPKVWVIPGRSRYHTHECRFAKGDSLREVTEATAVRRGYVPCTVCKPGAAA